MKSRNFASDNCFHETLTFTLEKLQKWTFIFQKRFWNLTNWCHTWKGFCTLRCEELYLLSCVTERRLSKRIIHTFKKINLYLYVVVQKLQRCNYFHIFHLLPLLHAKFSFQYQPKSISEISKCIVELHKSYGVLNLCRTEIL